MLVDSSVLIDVLLGDPTWAAWSATQLATAADSAQLVIDPVVYAELAMGFSTIEALDRVVDDHELRREALPFAACYLAGRVFIDYRRRGGTRTSVLPDFYIGAHAAVSGYRLLTRDVQRYRTYFPRLELIGPPST